MPGKDCRHSTQLIHSNRFDSIQRRSAIEDRVDERHTSTRGRRLFVVVNNDHVPGKEKPVCDGRPDITHSADQRP
jgi:hypothetical protein